MKWYLHKHHIQHLHDLNVKRGDSLEMYYPWVSQIANTFTRNSVAIGALNYQDLLQAGYVGLLEAWQNVDHSKEQAEKWSFIKKRIKGSIRREIDNNGAFIKIPRRQLEEHRKNMTNIDRILVNSFPAFFDYTKLVKFSEDVRPWIMERLQTLLEDYLYSNYKIYNVNILFDSFGIDTDNPLTHKELSKKYKKSITSLQNIKHRMIKNLKEDVEFKKLIENFYQN